MRIITPSDAAFNPSGASDSIGSSSFTYYNSFTASPPDFVVPPFVIGTIPADGHYQFSAAITFKNGTGDAPPSTFYANVTYVNGSGVTIGPVDILGIVGGLNQLYLVQAQPPILFLSQAGTSVSLDYGTTGFTGGSVDVTISAAVIRIA